MTHAELFPVASFRTRCFSCNVLSVSVCRLQDYPITKMSIKWTIVATILYAEIGMIIILLLPFISPTGWRKVLKARIFRNLENQPLSFIIVPFNVTVKVNHVFIAILVLIFMDAFRDMRRCSSEIELLKDASYGSFETQMQTRTKIFRAQRNYYISGFTLFLWLVLRRLVALISTQGTLIAQCATDVTQKALNEKKKRQTDDGEATGNIKREEYESEIIDLKNKLRASNEELNYVKIDMKSRKKQAEVLIKEYAFLVAELDKHQGHGGKKGR